MNKEGLLLLADHLDYGKLGHEKFDFRQYNNVVGPKCGTAGCAIGECPIVWPYYWEWSNNGLPVLNGSDRVSIPRNINKNGVIFHVMRWFDINLEQSNYLFVPDSGQCYIHGSVLPPTATRYEVAAHIRKFVIENDHD